MNIKPQKGMQEYLPEAAAQRDQLLNLILGTYTASGFTRIYTPAVESAETLDKSDGGDNLNLIFRIMKRAEALMKYAGETPAERLMGTTFTAIAFCGEFCKVLHIGNTRAYSMCGKYLKPLTKDHTTYQWYMTAGLPEKAENCNKSEITYCFGAGSMRYFQPVVKEISPSGFVLTSDGIHDFLSADELEELVFAHGDDYMTACRSIAEAALKNGSYDDMSVIIAVP